MTTSAPAAPVEKFRKDYKVPDYAIHKVDLIFKIFDGHTQVFSHISSHIHVPRISNHFWMASGHFLASSQAQGWCTSQLTTHAGCRRPGSE
jgi:hypothetical protein